MCSLYRSGLQCISACRSKGLDPRLRFQDAEMGSFCLRSLTYSTILLFLYSTVICYTILYSTMLKFYALPSCATLVPHPILFAMTSEANLAEA